MADGDDVEDAWAEECALRESWKIAGSPLRGNDYEQLARACARTRWLVAAVGTPEQRESRESVVGAARAKAVEVIVELRRRDRVRRISEIRAEMVAAQACGDAVKLKSLMRESLRMRAEDSDQ